MLSCRTFLRKRCNLQNLTRIYLKCLNKDNNSCIFTCKRALNTTKTSPNMDDKLIAIGQMRSTHDKELNREQVREIVQRGVQGRACVSFTKTKI